MNVHAVMVERGTDSLTGTRPFGPYDIVGELGRGSMGIVYRAVQRSLRRECALKTISWRLTSPHAVDRFVREGHAIARLGKHPHIAQVFDAGVVDGVAYIAMELIPGESLQSRIARAGPLEEADALEIGRKIALALDHAHRRGIVHRDVKLANIVLDVEGEPQLLDFGIAVDVDVREREDTPVGTPAYMAPEQADPRRGRPDPRTDVYALGATLYALVTGRLPFEASSVADLLFRVVWEEPKSPEVHAKVSGDLAAIILKALEKDPAARYQTALEMADDLSRVATGHPPRARNVGLVGRLLRKARRHREIASVVAALFVFATAAGVYFFHRSYEADRLWDDVWRRTSNATAREVRALLEPAVPLLEECRALAEAGLLPVDDQAMLAKHLVARFRFRPRLALDWLSYGDAKGRFTGVWRDEKGRVLVNLSWIDERGTGHLREVLADDMSTIVRSSDDWKYDPRTRPFYALASAAPGPVWTEPYEWYSAQGLGITATLALREGGRVRGAFTADTHLAALSRFLAGLNLGVRGRAYLLAGTGRLLASPDAGATAADALLSAALAALLPEGAGAAADPAAIERALGELPRGEPVAREFEHGDELYVAAFETIDSGSSLRPVTVVIVPEDEISGGVRRAAARTARIAGAAAALAAALAALSAFLRRRRVANAVRTHQRLRLPRPAAPDVSTADD